MLKKLIVEKPFIPLSCTIFIILLIALYKKGYLADIQIYDTYFVLTINFLGGFFAAVLLLNSIIYWFVRNRKMVKSLTAIQVCGTIGIVLYLMCTIGSPPDSKISLGKTLTIAEYRHLNQLNSQLILGISLLVLMQFLLLVNIIVTLITSRSRSI